MRLRYRPPADAFAAASARSEDAYSAACLPTVSMDDDDDRRSEASAVGGACLARQVLDATAPQPCDTEGVVDSRPQATFQSAMAKARAMQWRCVPAARLTRPVPRSMRARRGSCCGRGALQRALRGFPRPPAGLACSRALNPRFWRRSVNAVGRLLCGEWWGASGIDVALPSETQEPSEPAPEPVLKLPSSLAELPALPVRAAPKRRRGTPEALTHALLRGAGAAAGNRLRDRLCDACWLFASHACESRPARRARHSLAQRERAAACASCAARRGGGGER